MNTQRHFKWAIALVALLAAAAYGYWNFVREPDWRASAIEDVAFMRDTIRDDHPGFADPGNPGFADTLDAAYGRASAMAQRVEDPAGYYYATRAMAMPFQDAHLAPQYSRDLPRTRRWPGFFVGLEPGGANDAVVVIHGSGPSAPPLGSALVSCDGRSPEALYRERVLPFTFLSWLPAYRPGDWPWILIDAGNPFVENPSVCTFSVDGKPIDFPLTWIALDDEVRTRILGPIEPATNNVTQFSFVRETMAWISIASFFDSGENVSEDLAALIKEITAQRDRLKAARILVVDVRGNLGGASKAGYAVAQAIWGAGYIADRLPHFATADWRASKNNLDRIDDAVLPLRLRFGSDSELFRTVTSIRDGMKGAHAAGQAYFVQAQPALTSTGAEPLPLPATIYFLTDQSCVSACLDFADLMMSIEGVTQIGRETAGDTLYLEVTASEMPSGLGQLVYPTAIHRGRKRAVNASYRPASVFTGDISDREALADWILRLR